MKRMLTALMAMVALASPADSWYVPWVQGALSAGLIGPGAAVPLWTGTNLLPDGPITRAEAATLLYNLLQALRETQER